MNACEDRVGDSTRVLLVEAHALFRQALSLLLYRCPRMEVMQAGTLAEARLLLGSVDVVALDYVLPDGTGPDLIGEVRTTNPKASVLVMNNAPDTAIRRWRGRRADPWSIMPGEKSRLCPADER